MQVVGLDDESADAPGTANEGLTEKRLEPIRIGVIAYDVLSTIAEQPDMLSSARILKSSASRHAAYRAKLDLVRRETLGNRSDAPTSVDGMSVAGIA